MIRKTFIIAEKNYLLRRGLVATIQELIQADVLQEIDEAAHLAKAIERTQPDFLIVNPSFYAQLELDAQLKSRVGSSANTKLVALARSSSDLALKEFSFDVVLYKDDNKDELASKLQQMFDDSEPLEEELTEREKEIVRNIALGQTNKEIADSLFISPHTVITHRKNITQKLGIKSVSGLTVYAILNNLIKVGEVK